MKHNQQRSLNAEIKKVIGSRVILCSLILLVAIIGLTLVDMSTSLEHLRDQINHQVKPLEDFTIGEIMIDNPQAIVVKLKDFNQSTHLYDVKWVPYSHAPFKNVRLTLPFNWAYNYQLGNIAGYQFGYFKITGSLLTDHALIYSLALRLLVLIFFSIALFGFLYPVARRIPQELFVDPINRFIQLIAEPGAAKANNSQRNLPIELQSLEDNIQDLLSRAQKSERDKALNRQGEMARQVAHDLKNYVGSLYNHVDSADKLSISQKRKMKECLTDISNMSRNLLERYKVESLGQVTQQNNRNQAFSVLGQLRRVKSLIETTKNTDSTNIKVKANYDAYSTFIEVPPTGFNRVLSNLVKNAIEANANEVNISVNKSAHDTSIEIRDDGYGIPTKILDRLGKEELTYGKKGGNGIGLYYAMNEVKNWGGDISIQSKTDKGKGTCITLTIPRLLQLPEWFVENIDLTGISKIVIIDDDSNIHTRWNQRFKSQPIEIVSFSDAKSAITFLNSSECNHDNPLFLVDYHLGVDTEKGLDLIHRFNLEDHAILVTGEANDRDIIKRCINQGVKLLNKDSIEIVFCSGLIILQRS